MEELFLENIQLTANASAEEKEALSLIYITTFIGLIRKGGYLYKREIKDGFPSIVMIVNGHEYRCNEYLLYYYYGESVQLNPYEDTTLHLNEISLLDNLLKRGTGLVENEKEQKDRKTIEIPRIELAEKTPFEELPESPELTLTEEQQADYLIDTTESYKIGSSLNFIAGLACIVFSIVVLVLC